MLGRANVFQLQREDTLDGEAGRRRAPAAHLTARTPFDPPVEHDRLEELTARGWRVTRTRLTESFTLEHFRETHGDEAVLLFVQRGDRLEVVTEKTRRLPESDAVLYALVPGDG